MAKDLRLFIAIELSDPICDQISRTIERLQNTEPRHTIRWASPENIHLTLKFLGDTPPSHVNRIRINLDRAVRGFGVFSVEIEGAGCFPNPTKPRVVWLGLKNPGGELTTLRDAVEKHIAPLGYPTEQRSFKPHLTLGRVKRHVSVSTLTQIGRSIAHSNIGRLATWRCNAVSLMESQLTPDGAIYSCLAEIPLNPSTS